MTRAEFRIDRRSNSAEVAIETDRGVELVGLSTAEVVAGTTGAQRAALIDALGAIYAAALTKAGFASE